MPLNRPWKILVVDDRPEICEDLKEALESTKFGKPPLATQVEVESDFDNANKRLLQERFDLVVLDVRKDAPSVDESAGARILSDLRKLKFVPVVFYTALPRLVKDETSTFVAVVEKTQGTDALITAVEQVFGTLLPLLLRHLEEEQRKYLWEELPKLAKSYPQSLDPSEPVYLLARRLAQELSGSSIRSFLSLPKDKIHPAEFYVFPSKHIDPLCGDVCKPPSSDKSNHWVIVTPSCDLAIRPDGKVNAEFILLAGTEILSNTKEYKDWQTSRSKSNPQGSNNSKIALEKLLTNNRSGQASRFHFLPGIGPIPDSVIDFQNLRTISRKELGDNWTRLASLDNPFAEQVLNRFLNYFGRIGTPDINVDTVLSRIRQPDPPSGKK